MKGRFLKQRWLWLGAALCAGYVLALLLLLAAERGHPDASIRTFGDALWYSVVTLSTVGYGDLYPITALGRVLGVLFVLMSAGVLTFVLGVFVSLVTGRAVPALRLALLQDRQWYVFPRANPQSVALAGDLTQKEPECAVLFTGQSGAAALPGSCFSLPTEALVKRCRRKDRCTVFFLGAEASETEARSLLSLGCRVVCQTGQAADTPPEGLSYFDECEATARIFWQQHPLCRQESTVVLLGCGDHARQLLERALLVNVGIVPTGTEYHLFGDWTAFRQEHFRLPETLAQPGEPGDRLVFHKETFPGDSDLLTGASRIVICADSMQENVLLCRRLRRYFPVEGRVFLRTDEAETGAVCFGAAREICTGETVLRRKLNRMAEQMHGIYRASVGGSAPAWEELSEFLRQSNIAAADHVLTKVRLLLDDDSITHVDFRLCRQAFERFCLSREHRGEEFRRIEHLRWMRFHSLYNWSFAPQRDNALRRHPMMLPYDKLSPEEQRKDDFAWELLGELSSVLSDG